MPTEQHRRRALPVGLIVVLVAVGVALAWRGCAFYLLDLDGRVDHPDFQTLRPSGTIGHGYGFVAAFLVFTNLLYLLRRRGVFRTGSMRTWLDLHAFTGILAAIFAAVHSALQLRTPVATATSVSLVIVVLSGVVGRVLHALIPRSDGARLGDALAALEPHLPGVGPSARAILDSYPGPALPANASLWTSLRALPGFLRAARDRREALAVVVGAHAGADHADPIRASRVNDVLDLAAGELRGAGSAALLRSWRSLHRLFAILMLVTVVVHVAVAWHYGYRWIFS